MLKKKNKLSIAIFLFILLPSSLIGLDGVYFKDLSNEYDCNNIKISNLYNTTIQVDDLPNSIYDWEWAESQPWCSGSGTKIDPYIIENQVFVINNSGATCLSIKNSEKYFIIENCSFFDTLLSGSGSGVYLYNVTNANIINSRMHHKYQGVYLDHSYKNLIFGNNLTNNQERGILTVESDNNNISKNLVSFNKFGIFLGGGSDNNTLIENNCSENSYGIKLYYADYNSFIKFRLLNDDIDIEQSNYNAFSESIIQNSGISLLNSHHTSFYLNDIFNSGGSGYNFVYSSDNILFGNNILSSGSSGISFYESRRNEIVNNFIENSGEYGIKLYGNIDGAGSCYNNFLNNSILNNNKHGIYLDFSGLNNFYSNIIQGNKESGFYAVTSHQVNFENNIVNNNTLHGVEAYCDSLYNIIGNEIKYNGLNGLYLHRYSDLYNITNNIIEGNVNAGLSIQDSSHYNNIFNNYFINNGYNADDSESDNYWNCSYIGNYWNDYTGFDENDDGIGDTPYAIGQGTDYLPIWLDGPNITINSPFENKLFSNPPDFNITTVDLTIDKKWYTVQTSPMKYFFTQNGTINATAWYNCVDGNVLIKFFANDTGGNEKFVIINVKKDSNIPEINVISPSSYETFEMSPSFSLDMSDYSLNYTWYILNNGGIKYFFSGVSGDIYNLAWNSISEGYVNITFYANDSLNQVNSVQITIIKDLSYPIITVNSPINGQIFYDDSPRYNVTVLDYSLHQKWYEIEGISTKFYYSASLGKINQQTWEQLPLGNIVIIFFAEDSLGKISNCSIMIIKEPNPVSIPGLNLLALLGITCISFIVIIKKLKKNYKIKRLDF